MEIKVDRYSFGLIAVNGKIYDKDIIVFPDRVKSNWWRKQGHTLLIEDLSDVIEYKPEILVIGKGAYGFMKIPEETQSFLKNNDIELIERVTDEAYKIFNKYIEQGKKVVGAFHLTC